MLLPGGTQGTLHLNFAPFSKMFFLAGHGRLHRGRQSGDQGTGSGHQVRHLGAASKQAGSKQARIGVVWTAQLSGSACKPPCLLGMRACPAPRCSCPLLMPHCPMPPRRRCCRDRPQLPFRCLDGQYRRELVRVYLTNVEGIARRFVDEKREYLQVGPCLYTVTWVQVCGILPARKHRRGCLSVCSLSGSTCSW